MVRLVLAGFGWAQCERGAPLLAIAAGVWRLLRPTNEPISTGDDQ